MGLHRKPNVTVENERRNPGPFSRSGALPKRSSVTRSHPRSLTPIQRRERHRRGKSTGGWIRRGSVPLVGGWRHAHYNSDAVNAFPPLNQLETSSSPFSLIKRKPLARSGQEVKRGPTSLPCRWAFRRLRRQGRKWPRRNIPATKVN